jgi:hypothetical protein
MIDEIGGQSGQKRERIFRKEFYSRDDLLEVPFLGQSQDPVAILA